MINHHIKHTNMELTPAISDYLAKKLAALDKFVEDKAAIARIEVGRMNNHHHKGEVFSAEINLEFGGNKFRAVAASDDMYRAIDMMRDEIVGEVVRSSKKKRHLLRRGKQKIKDLMRRFRS
ncbi:MAG: ribosome-associated translation inhibitor RaiA [Patescibacteria group bacterium]